MALLSWIVASTIVTIAAAGNWGFGKEVTALLLEHRAEIRIAKNVLVTAARNPEFGKEVMTPFLTTSGD